MYSIQLTKKSRDFLHSIKKEEAEFIVKEIYKLRNNPFDYPLKKLKGYKLYRLKIKKYRAILNILIIRKQIVVLQIGFRKNVYRKFFDKKR